MIQLYLTLEGWDKKPELKPAEAFQGPKPPLPKDTRRHTYQPRENVRNYLKHQPILQRWVFAEASKLSTYHCSTHMYLVFLFFDDDAAVLDVLSLADDVLDEGDPPPLLLTASGIKSPLFCSIFDR